MTADPSDGNVAAVDTSAQDQVIADIADNWEEAPPPVSVAGPGPEPVGPATSVTRGTPGTWLPEGADPPADLTAINTYYNGVNAMNPAPGLPPKFWRDGQYAVLADNMEIHYSAPSAGAFPEWFEGRAPDAPATANAGAPGTIDPSGHAPAEVAADLTAYGTVASPTTAWLTGEHVSLWTSAAYWNGTTWVDGQAP